MIVSAVSLWKKFNMKTPLGESEWGKEERNGVLYSHVSFFGHSVEDGKVRIYARYIRSAKGEHPAVLLIPDVNDLPDEELAEYFLEKGYSVLIPDYAGKMKTDGEGVLRTSYPQSLAYGNFEQAKGFYDMDGMPADQTTWFEWTYVALYAIEYLKSRPEIGNIGIVGIRTGGDIAWHAMLSSDLKCGVPINATGWNSFLATPKFGDATVHGLSDDKHRFIAATEAQSYAPYVKCPVLMLCALRDGRFDCDRAYDTYARIGNADGNAIAYSPESGACIGPRGLANLDLFLEKNLKGREIYIPVPLNVNLKEENGEICIQVEGDQEGLLEEMGIYYAEADPQMNSTYRDWKLICKAEGRILKNNRLQHTVKPFAGAPAVFVYAYAKYINGFRVMSKIACKRRADLQQNATRSRMIYAGKDPDCFTVANYKKSAVGEIFLERESMAKTNKGYGDILGAYSVEGIKTFRVGSPKYHPDENALLEFDAYSATTQEIRVSVAVWNGELGEEIYLSVVAKTLANENSKANSENDAEIQPWKIIRVKGELGTEIRNKASFVTCANMFNELYYDTAKPLEEQAKKYTNTLISYATERSMILVVEPAFPRSSRFISLTRDALIRKKFSIISPCPHTKECCMDGRKGGKWCHFVLDTSFAPKKLHKLSDKAGLPKDRASLSFVFAQNFEETQNDELKIRVVSDMIKLPQNATGRYACSRLGLTLVKSNFTNSKKFDSGSLISTEDATNKIESSAKIDTKSGAKIIEV